MALSFFGKLFGQKNRISDELIWIYTQCDQCGEKFRTVIQKNHDLTPTYQQNGPTYFVRKEIIGSSCHNRINLTIHFDQNYNRLSQEITGGHFISQEQYEAENN